VLDPREFTGVLSPLADIEFLERVYIDRGSPAWPRDIDLPPNALYRQIADERTFVSAPPELGPDFRIGRRPESEGTRQ
jgi:hypothetical protein